MNQLRNVVCPGCTCLCDDLHVNEKNGSVEVRNACEMGNRWFADLTVASEKCQIDGQAIDLPSAIERCSNMLRESTAPLICGLDHLTTQSQQSAWNLADRTGANIDILFSNAGRASQFALQRVGKVSATLGEVAHRSDVIIFWFCDPMTTHPRHLERYSNPAGLPKRKIIVVDDCRTATAEKADLFIELSRPNATAALATLRACLSGLQLDSQAVKQSTGLDVESWQKLSQHLSAAKYGALFYGHTTHDSNFDSANDSLASLVRELNNKTRFVSLSMRSDANSQSAENVLAWSSGFPFAVNLNRRYPRSNWLEYSAAEILRRGECDMILVASTGGLSRQIDALGNTAAKHFQATPKIVLFSEAEAKAEAECGLENVAACITVSLPGFNESGDSCRQDDVLLPLVKLVGDDTLPSAGHILDAIATVISD